MSKVHVSQQSQSERSIEQTSASSSALPDINAETYPFEIVQHLLNQAAYFNMYSTPNPDYPNTAIHAPGNANGVIGIRVHEILHRFDISVQPSTPDNPLRAYNTVGAPAATFDHRWMLIPHAFSALPDRAPPSTLFDMSHSQRFVMLDGVCKFGNGQDGFYGFGTGLTYPVTVQGRRELLAASIGTIMEGFGKFQDLEGTYTYGGTLCADRGFQGNLVCRVMDPEGTLRSERELPPVKPMSESEPGITYIILHGEKRDKTAKTTYSFGLDGQVNGLIVEQQLRLFHLNFASQGRGGLRSVECIGQVIGKMTSKILFNLFNPGAPGTATAPIPFSAYNELTFFDRNGQILGGFVGDGGEGRTFNMTLANAPGQQALRFGGVGPLRHGTGCFRGIEGLMTDNSVVGVAPHVTSTLYVLRINDPDGQYRAGFSGKTQQQAT